MLCLWRWCESLYCTTMSFLCLCLWSIFFLVTAHFDPEWSFFASKKSHLKFTFYQKKNAQLLNRNINIEYELKLKISSSPHEAPPKMQDVPLVLLRFHAIIFMYVLELMCECILRMEVKNYWVDNGRGYHSHFKRIHTRLPLREIS